jgi:hypothetical protein
MIFIFYFLDKVKNIYLSYHLNFIASLNIFYEFAETVAAVRSRAWQLPRD